MRGYTRRVPDPNLLMLGVLLALAVMIILRGRRQRAELAGVQQALAPGQEVMTASGMYATVVALTDDQVTLETAPGQTSRWDRRAVVRVVPAPSAAPPPDAAGSAEPTA